MITESPLKMKRFLFCEIRAYDKAAIKYSGRETITNFKSSTYGTGIESEEASAENLDLNLGVSPTNIETVDMGEGKMQKLANFQVGEVTMHSSEEMRKETAWGMQMVGGHHVAAASSGFASFITKFSDSLFLSNANMYQRPTATYSHY